MGYKGDLLNLYEFVRYLARKSFYDRDAYKQLEVLSRNALNNHDAAVSESVIYCSSFTEGFSNTFSFDSAIASCDLDSIFSPKINRAYFINNKFTYFMKIKILYG